MTKPCHRALEQLCEGQNAQSFRLTHLKTTARKKSRIRKYTADMNANELMT